MFLLPEVDRVSEALDRSALRTVDHFIPLALGGHDNLSNVVLACLPCNRRKADREPEIPEFVKWNELAKRWPHINPVSLALHVRKRCATCNAPIFWERVLQSIESGGETDTCSRICHLAAKKSRRLSRARPSSSQVFLRQNDEPAQ